MNSRDDERLDSTVNEASSGRIYDYLLGGTHNYAIDRMFVDERMKVAPDMQIGARLNRAFLGQAVRYAIDRGIRQFVDIGSGLPTAGNVHEVADQAAPGECHVVYIDNEPVARAHAEILLENTADPNRHTAIDGDFNEPAKLWQQVHNTGLINPDKPTALLTVALLHFLPADLRPEQTLRYYRDQLAPGSAIAISHMYIDPADTAARGAADRIANAYQKQSNSFIVRRERAEISAFFDGLDMVEPGLVWVPEWRPDGEEYDLSAVEHSRILAGVGIVPGLR